jgi:hypothetical protein
MLLWEGWRGISAAADLHRSLGLASRVAPVCLCDLFLNAAMRFRRRFVRRHS